MWPFHNKNSQKSFGAIFSMIGLLLTAIGLNQPLTTIFGFQILGVGFIIFIIGLLYLIEVTFD